MELKEHLMERILVLVQFGLELVLELILVVKTVELDEDEDAQLAF